MFSILWYAPNYHVFRVWFYNIYPLYLKKLGIRNRCIGHYICLLFSSKTLSVNFIILTCIQRDIVLHVQFSLCEVPLIFVSI